MRGIIWRTSLLVLLLAGVAMGARAQVVLTPKFHSLGKIIPGKSYQMKVKISNPTAQTLSLWNLRVDCDCTTAHIPKPVLKPKESTIMSVVYSPLRGDDGFKNLAIEFQVYSQDKTRAIHKTVQKFIFNAELHSPYVFAPPVLDGGYALYGHGIQVHGTLKLDTKTYTHWKAGPPQVSVAGISVDLKPLATPGAYDVQLSVPATLKAGTYSGTITLTGANPKDEQFEYPFKATVGSLWSLTPNRLDLGLLTPAQLKVWKQGTHIHEIYGKPFNITKIEGLPDWLSYHLGKDPIGDTLIQWQVDAGRFAGEKVDALPEAVTVHTDLAAEPDFSLELSGTWPVVKRETPVTMTKTARPTPVPSPTVSLKKK